MVEIVAALAIAPWSHPVHFQPLAGWRAGANGTFSSSYGPVPGNPSPRQSTAWMAKGVRYRDRRTADPPGATLARLPRRAILVFATIYESGPSTAKRIELRLERARRYPCCDGTYVAGGEYELDGAGPATADSVIVRVYFGSAPTRSMRKQAQLALNRLQLPAPR